MKNEPAVTLEELEKTHSLAEYVIRRIWNHSQEVIERAAEILVGGEDEKGNK